MLQVPAPPSAGTSIEPHNNGGGGSPTVYWQSPLTLTTTGCPIRDGVLYYLARIFNLRQRSDDGDIPTGSGTFTASVPALFPAHGAASVSMSIDCGGGGTIITGFDLYIDPSGTVRDSHGAPISGAMVTLLRSDTAMGPFDIVPDGSAVMSPGNRHNPDMTDADGHFGWDVLAGFYKVRAENAGCNGMVETGVLQIPPPVTDLVLTLDCPTELIGAVSRKHHGAAGDLDIPLALAGAPTVECRSSGGNHALVFTFSNNVVSGGATLTTQSGGSISGSNFCRQCHDGKSDWRYRLAEDHSHPKRGDGRVCPSDTRHGRKHEPSHWRYDRKQTRKLNRRLNKQRCSPVTP